MSEGYVGLAIAFFQAVAAIAKEIPTLKKLFSSRDERIRGLAKQLQEELVAYCDQLEDCVKKTRESLGHDEKLLKAPLSAVDALWQGQQKWWNTVFRRPPGARVKAALQRLDGFGDRLTALLICQEENDELRQRAATSGELNVRYAAVIGKDPPIHEVLARMENDAMNIRKQAGTLGTL